jgi:hypothetical protein
MVIETITLSLLLGKLTGGKIRNLEYLYIKGWYFFAASFLVEIASLLIVSKGIGNLSDIIEDRFFYIHIFIYVLLIIGLFMNFDENGFRITLLGSILNFIPLLLNNGRMPVLVNALKYSKLYNQLTLLEEGRILTHTLASETTKFIYLCDIIPIPEPYIFPKIISVGDILIGVGLFVVIFSYMKRKFKGNKIFADYYKP